ncbi:MAG: sensor domain-containing protein [Acidimicrobiales bacterium]
MPQVNEMSGLAVPLGEWADGSRTLVMATRAGAGDLVRMAGLSEGEAAIVHTLDDAFPVLCRERFAAVLLSLPMEGKTLATAVEELRIVRRGPAIIVVGNLDDRSTVLTMGADAFVDRSRLGESELREALRCGRDAGRRVERLLGHLIHQRHLVDSLLEGVVVFSVTGRVVYVNSRACDVLGRRDDELLFRPLPVHELQLADENGVPVPPEQLVSAQALRVGRPVEARTFQLRRPDGEVRWVEVFSSPLLRRSTDAVYAAVSCFRDVTVERGAHAARLAVERRQRRLLEHATDGYLVVDRQLRVIEASQSIHRVMHGAVAAGADVGSLVHPEDRQRIHQAVSDACEGPRSTRRLEVRVALPDGADPGQVEERWLEAALTGRCGDPSIGGVVVNLSDVTARKRAERERRQAEERFRLGFEHGTAGMTVTDLDGRIVEVNRAFCLLLGVPATRLVGTMIGDAVHPEDRAERLDRRQRLLSGDINHYRSERRYLRGDGSVVWCLLSVSLIRDDSDRPRYLFSQFQDITDRMLNEAALEHRVHHDVLTELPNRRGLEICLDAALARAADAGTKVAVLFLDVDHFKVVNDSLGHAAGDVILVETAQRLSAAVRDGDTVARFGGDEFIVVCENVADVDEADLLARRTVDLFDQPFDVDGKPIAVTASCGIVVVEGEATAEDALRDADAAMYQAKERGRARPQMFDERVRRAASDRLELEQALRRSVDAEGFHVAFQPVVAVEDGRTVGAEALARWEHPDRGPVSPEEFIPAAEEAGLIVRIGDFVLDSALAEVARWRTSLPGCEELWVAVNLSSRQLSFGNTVASCERLLDKHGVPPSSLRLELTESALIWDLESSVRTIEQLGSLGVEVAIDDFGTGYSSLSYLSRLPVSMLKIDRSFVAGIGTDRHASEIVRAVATLARTLGLETCAEGVERTDQLELVSRLGCELAQGYLWSRPLEPREFEMFVAGQLGAPRAGVG